MFREVISKIRIALLLVMLVSLVLPISSVFASDISVSFSVIHESPVGATVRAVITGVDSYQNIQVVVVPHDSSVTSTPIQNANITILDVQDVTKSREIPVYADVDSTLDDFIESYCTYDEITGDSKGIEQQDIDALETIRDTEKKLEDKGNPVTVKEIKGQDLKELSKEVKDALMVFPDTINKQVDSYTEYYQQEEKTALKNVKARGSFSAPYTTTNQITIDFDINIPISSVNTQIAPYNTSGLLAVVIDGIYYYDKTHSSWWDAAWHYRKVLAFNAETISENLTDFPVGVFLTHTNFDFSLASSNGSDIRFIDKDGATELSYEMVSYNATAEYAELWVKVPQVDALSPYSDYIYIYYGNASAPYEDHSTGSALGNAVWNSNYAMIQHMADATTSTTKDSTANTNNGTKASANHPAETDGKVGKAQQYSGVNDIVNCGDGTSLDITAAITLEAVINATTITTGNQFIVARDDGANRNFVLQLSPNAGKNDLIAGCWIANVGHGATLASYSDTYFNAWHYIVATYDGSYWRIYIDGTLAITPVACTGAIDNGNVSFTIGDRAALDRPFTGKIDEVRVSNCARSAAWIKATYMTCYDTFVYYGSTDPEPTMTTSEASNITMDKDGNTVTQLNGILDDLGGIPTTDVWFEYGSTSGVYTANTTKILAVAVAPYAYSTNVTGLTPGGIYYFRAVGENADGMGVGVEKSFTFTMPTIVTGSATNVQMTGTGTSAQINGTISNMGVASSSYYKVEWGYNTSYGNTSSVQTALIAGDYNATIYHFMPNQTIHYRYVVYNGTTYVYGSDQTLYLPSSGGDSTSNTYNMGILVVLILAAVGIYFMLKCFESGNIVLGIIILVIIAYLVIISVAGLNSIVNSIL